MQSRKELAAIIAAYAWSGFALSLLTELRAILPTSAYGGIVVSIVVPILAASYRIGFEDLIIKLRAYVRRKRERKKRHELVKNWYLNLLDLLIIVDKVVVGDKKATKKQKEKYDRARNWFHKQRSELLPIWHFFSRNRTEQAYERDHYRSKAYDYVFSKNWNDPFSCFYEPYSLELLKATIENERLAKDLRFAMSKLIERTEEFVNWHRSEYD
jgi:hypothetical protein